MEDINKQSSKRRRFRKSRFKRNNNQKRYSDKTSINSTGQSAQQKKSFVSNIHSSADEKTYEDVNGSFLLKPAESLSCLICNRPIIDMYSAIESGDKDEPSHFECMVTLLSEKENLNEKDKICYMGNGSFGIIEIQRTRRRRGKSYNRIVTIKKRIQVVDSESRPQWRIQLIAIKPSVR